MVSVRAIGILIVCALLAFFICVGNKDVFEGKGAFNAIAVYIIITGFFFGVVMLIWWAVRMIITGAF